MNKSRTLLSATVAVALTTLSATPAMAAFVLNGTRYIYDEGKKNLSMEVTNNAKETYGGQVWVENATQDKAGVFMVPSPPVFKVEPGKKQVVRLMNVNPALPTDRESLFWINVQELPPKPAQTDGGAAIAIAMNTRVKLIYRPKAVSEGRKDAERKITTERRDGVVWLKNPTPYWFAVTGLKVNGKDVEIPKAQQQGLAQLPPFGGVSTGVRSEGRLGVKAINDWGGIQDYDVQ